MGRATIVLGLQFGDEGKGGVVDALTRIGDVGLVVRFNGGAQAAHNVVLPDGRHHTFSQFGSGTFAGAHTHLSRFTVVDPLNVASEAMHLREVGVTRPFELLTVDPNALIITPFHRDANRQRELARGDRRHGSCGVGVGEAVRTSLELPECAIHAADLRDVAVVRDKLETLISHLDVDVPDVKWSETVGDVASAFRLMSRHITLRDDYDALRSVDDVILEGAQGVLLDEWHGFHPHTTWSNCTFDNALALLSDADFAGDVVRLGVTRRLTSRHGPGPLPSHDATLTSRVDEIHNGFNEWQREFRCGWLDVSLLRYALDVVRGVDELAVTHVDADVDRACVGIELDGRLIELTPNWERDLARQERLARDLLAATPVIVREPCGSSFIEDVTSSPVTLCSFGRTWREKITYPR